MPRCRITVLKRTLNPEIAGAFCRREAGACENFREGQEFTTSFAKPSGFCDWAWNDIHKYVATLLAGGSFGGRLFDGWMKDDRTMVACCTDGVRPVVFALERIED